MAGGWVEQRRYGPYPVRPRRRRRRTTSSRGSPTAPPWPGSSAPPGTGAASRASSPARASGSTGARASARTWPPRSARRCATAPASSTPATASAPSGPATSTATPRASPSAPAPRSSPPPATSGRRSPGSSPATTCTCSRSTPSTPSTSRPGFSHQNLYSDLSAPGEAIFVAVPCWADVEDGVADGYSRWDGTSFAAPMVSAAAAWVLAQSPRLSADQVAEILRRSARDIAPAGVGHLDRLGRARPRGGRARAHPAQRPVRAERRHPLDLRAQRLRGRRPLPAHLGPGRGPRPDRRPEGPGQRLPGLGAGGRTRLGAPDAPRHARRPLRLAADCPQRPTARAPSPRAAGGPCRASP